MRRIFEYELNAQVSSENFKSEVGALGQQLRFFCFNALRVPFKVWRLKMVLKIPQSSNSAVCFLNRPLKTTNFFSKSFVEIESPYSSFSFLSCKASSDGFASTQCPLQREASHKSGRCSFLASLVGANLVLQAYKPNTKPFPMKNSCFNALQIFKLLLQFFFHDCLVTSRSSPSIIWI